MLSREENKTLTQVGPGTPVGELMRRYWMPALLSSDIPTPDCPPVRVKLLGEELVAFRDTQGRVGLLDEFCPHRRASLFLGRNEECGLRCVGGAERRSCAIRSAASSYLVTRRFVGLRFAAGFRRTELPVGGTYCLTAVQVFQCDFHHAVLRKDVT